MKISMNLKPIPYSVLILVWTYTGLEKLIRFESSRNAFLNQPFPEELANALAYLVPLSEILLALLLLVPFLRWWGYLGSMMLLNVFTTYIGLIWVGAFPRVPCNCAGLLESLDWGAHFWINWALIGINAIGITSERLSFSHSNPDKQLSNEGKTEK